MSISAHGIRGGEGLESDVMNFPEASQGYNEPKLIFRMCLKSMKTPTCMKLFEVQDPTGLFVFVGDVSGCLAVGKVGRTSGGNIGPKIALHGDGILDIELDQEHASICFQSCLRLSTLGRDGNYNKAFIRLGKNKFEILQTHQCPLTRGSLEAFLNFSSSSRYIGGFEKAFWKLFNLQSGTMACLPLSVSTNILPSNFFFSPSIRSVVVKLSATDSPTCGFVWSEEADAIFFTNSKDP